jgi:hypothetical protein
MLRGSFSCLGDDRMLTQMTLLIAPLTIEFRLLASKHDG